MRHLLSIRDLTAADLQPHPRPVRAAPAPRVLAGQGRRALFREAERAHAQFDGAGGGAARRPSGLHPEGRARHRHARERRRRDAHARLLSRDHRRRACSITACSSEMARVNARRCSTCSRHRSSAAGARRPADDQAAARPHRRREGRLYRRGEQCLALAGRGLRAGRRRVRHRQPRRAMASKAAYGKSSIRRSGRRRGHRLHRRLGLDGRGGQ